MELSISLNDIEYAETFLAAGDLSAALPLLEKLRELAEEYIDVACQTQENLQFFSFESAFERLAYRRVERDPRELEQVPVPFDRIYADLAFAYIREQDFERARDMLMQAVRWNPMNCNYRLDLAELFRALDDKREWAALSVSVLRRASDAVSAARAWANLGQFFLDDEVQNVNAAEGCARLAARFAPNDPRVERLRNRMATEHPEAAEEEDKVVMAALGGEGVPCSLSADVAVCLIMCATDASAAGDTDEATRLTIRARDLIGEEAVAALVKLVREGDAGLEAERAGGEASDAE